MFSYWSHSYCLGCTFLLLLFPHLFQLFLWPLVLLHLFVLLLSDIVASGDCHIYHSCPLLLLFDHHYGRLVWNIWFSAISGCVFHWDGTRGLLINSQHSVFRPVLFAPMTRASLRSIGQHSPGTGRVLWCHPLPCWFVAWWGFVFHYNYYFFMDLRILLVSPWIMAVRVLGCCTLGGTFHGLVAFISSCG